MSGIRVLHCPWMVGGNPQQLARSERELGLASWSVAFKQNAFGHPADELLLENVGGFRAEFRRWRLLWRAAREFDVIHYNFGETIMRPTTPELLQRQGFIAALKRKYIQKYELYDAELLHRKGKAIFVTFQGDDARQGDYCREHFNPHFVTEVEDGYYSKSSDDIKRDRIRRFSSLADRIYALNPDLLHVLPETARFMPYSHIDIREWKPVEKAYATVPTVVHAPSHRKVKGTRYILEAVERLKAEGIEMNFILVEGMTQVEAQKIYARADLLIDQMLAGWYGGLAVELMAMGTPVMCHIRDSDLKFIPAPMREELPVIPVTPTTLADALRDYLRNRPTRSAALRERSRNYVEKWHDPLKIAGQLKTEYQSVLAQKSASKAVS